MKNLLATALILAFAGVATADTMPSLGHRMHVPGQASERATHFSIGTDAVDLDAEVANVEALRETVAYLERRAMMLEWIIFRYCGDVTRESCL